MQVFNSSDHMVIGEFQDYFLIMGGLLYFVIAMTPENPLDYRGFQRPQNDFLGRLHTAGANQFDSMAA